MSSGNSLDSVRLLLHSEGQANWVLVERDAPVELMRSILYNKVAEIKEMLAKNASPANLTERGEILKLISWVNERDAQLALLGQEQRTRFVELSKKQFTGKSRSVKKDLDKISEEEADEKRITVHNGDKLLVSVHKKSPHEKLDFVKKQLDFKLDDSQRKTLDSWLAASEPKKEEQKIQLPSNDGLAPQELSQNTPKALLELAFQERRKELDSSNQNLLKTWLERSPETAADIVHVFHGGKNSPQQSSEIKLSNHGPDFVAEIYRQLEDGAYILPEHRKRLDTYRDELAAKKKDPAFFEVPTEIPGLFTYLPADTSKDILQVALETRKAILSPSLISRLERETKDTPKEKNETELRVYDLRDPSKYATITKDQQALDIGNAISSIGAKNAYLRPADVKVLNGWFGLDSERANSLPKAIEAHHSTGISLTIDESLLKQYPGKIEEILADSTWSMEPSDRKQLQNSLSSRGSSEDDQFSFAGKAYSKHSSLKELKELAAKFAEDEEINLPGEHAKKLLTWISKKEKYGDKPSPVQTEIESVHKEAIKKKTIHIANLESVLNEMASHQSQTVDGYYSEIWGADKAPLAAGPMGATLSGLRPMGIWQFTEVLQSAMRDNLYAKKLGDLHESAKQVHQLKAQSEPDLPTPKVDFNTLGRGSGTISETEKQIHQMGKEKLDIAISQIYSAIRDLKSKEVNRNPNRNNKDIAENLLPGPNAHRGPGGLGGLGS